MDTKWTRENSIAFFRDHQKPLYLPNIHQSSRLMENMCEKHLVNGFWCSLKEKYNKFALSILNYEKRSFGLTPQFTLLILVHHVLEMPVRKGVPRKWNFRRNFCKSKRKPGKQGMRDYLTCKNYKCNHQGVNVTRIHSRKVFSNWTAWCKLQNRM